MRARDLIVSYWSDIRMTKTWYLIRGSANEWSAQVELNRKLYDFRGEEAENFLLDSNEQQKKNVESEAWE